MAKYSGFTSEDIDAIHKNASEQWKPVFEVLAFSGIRPAELVWLRWMDVDMVGNVLHIRQQRGWKPKFGVARSVPMHPRVRAVLEQLPRYYSWVFTSEPSERFPVAGRRISGLQLLQAFRTAMRTAGITKGTAHGLRSFYLWHIANKTSPGGEAK
ncbi:MAG: tyrosine-type recombinase/integrase [Fimbriimonadaceae bacterium]|nr:tyrosine-type recombinase/integrase [Fimbriimonadaceae bacterium]MCZ7647972.1 tyrosine-type recombinase/integrase [Planctomycetota bacterium]